MRVPENCGDGKAQAIIYFPGCKLKPSPIVKNYLVGAAASKVQTVTQKFSFEGAVPKSCKLVVSNEENKTVFTKEIIQPGNVKIALPGAGYYVLEYKAEGYWPLVSFVHVEGNEAKFEPAVTMYLMRFVTLRYQHAAMGTSFSQAHLAEVVVWPKDNTRELETNWSFDLKADDTGVAKLTLSYSKWGKFNGILVKGDIFSTAKKAPNKGYKPCGRMALEVGKTYFFRNDDGPKPKYTKMEIIAVSKTPPVVPKRKE